MIGSISTEWTWASTAAPVGKALDAPDDRRWTLLRLEVISATAAKSPAVLIVALWALEKGAAQ